MRWADKTSPSEHAQVPARVWLRWKPFAIAFALLALLLSAGAGSSRAAAGDETLRHDVEILAAPDSRVIGSEGYDRAGQYLEAQFRSLPNVEWRRHEFVVQMPVTRRATLTIGGQTHDVYPFWPAQVRVNSTPDSGIAGRLVYLDLKRGFAGVRPADVAGQIAVVEASAGKDWTQAAYFGAKAILVLGSDDDTNLGFRWHDLVVPVNMPRFYVPPGPLAERLRRGEIRTPATLHAVVRWQAVTARNYYALVPGTAGDSAPALMFSAPFDSSSLVPDRSPGASQAAQTAAGLALLRHFSAHPAPRPVVVFFGGGDSVQFLASRNMFMALSDVPAVWRAQLDELARRQRDAEDDLQRLRRIAASSPPVIDLAADRRAIDRVVTLIETDSALEQDLLFRARTAQGASAATTRPSIDVDELERRHSLLSRLRYAFLDRPQRLREDDLSGPARHYLGRAIAQLEGNPAEDAPVDSDSQGLIEQYAARQRVLRQRIDLYEWLAHATGMNPNPGTRENESRLIELLVAIDLSDNGVRCGPMYWGGWLRSSNISDIQNYRDWFEQHSGISGGGGGSSLPANLDFQPLSGVRSPQSWLAAPLAIGSELCRAFATPGLSMITLDDLRLRRDTPADTLANLNLDAIAPQLDAVVKLFDRAWRDPAFRSRDTARWQRDSINGQVVSPSAGRPVPDLPRGGFVAAYTPAVKGPVSPRLTDSAWILGVRHNEIAACDAEGYYRFEGLPAGISVYENFYISAYRLADDGSVTATNDLARQDEGLSPYINIRAASPFPLRSVVFPCEEYSLFGLYDPRFLQSLGEVQLLDARRNAPPLRYNLILCNEMLAGFVEPGTRSNLIFRYGQVGNRLLLVNMPEPRRQSAAEAEASEAGGGDAAAAQALGRTAAQLDDLPPPALATARDFWRLDEVRLNQYRRAGVSSGVLDALHVQSGREIDQAADALRADDGAALMRHAAGAWAGEARVYTAAQDMAQDVVRGAIFLLLLCVPFSFCMERLLIGTPNIYRQIAGAAAIFAVMALALWSFHPAFKISASPLIIILAFAIILMSVVVIGVIYGRFDTELKRIRSGRGSAETASFARASVLASAVLLGIANMRRRRFRTALTSITIVLITFAVLCFTSATRFVETTSLPTGVETRRPGIMLRQRGFRPMPDAVLDQLRCALPEVRQAMAARWWNANAADPREQLHLVASSSSSSSSSGSGGSVNAAPRVVAVPALLGLSPGERAVSPEIPQIVGPDAWARLENGEQRLIYLPRPIADQLGVAVGDVVAIGGIDLEVASIFDPAAFDRDVRMLSGETIAPLRYAAGQLDAGGRGLNDSEAEALDLDAQASRAELAGSYEHLQASQYAIVPAAVSRMLPNATLRSLAIPLSGEQEVKQVSDELARRFALALFAGFDDGVRLVSSGATLPRVSGAGQVAVPVAIAGLIVFNTMMGSIAERRREIHVYTSIGLAPLHVGALFVAEACVYGLIGTVFGYIIGQGVGTLMLHLGWLGNAVTLNYSGTSAMLTMGLILGVVLVSALVPARLASQVAAPSIERSWQVPLPSGDIIQATLPFTINRTAADGALAYLAEFFDAHREGSIGKFSAGDVEFLARDRERGLKTTIWLTPFDLGVRQDLTLLIRPGQRFQDIYEVQVILRRLSGDDGSWHRMNRSFLTELRKQFLQWRSLAPQRMMEYVEESRRAFATT